MAGKSASPSSDVYSLGVCFYESLGRRRFGWAGDEEDSHGTQINTRFSDINWTSFGEAAEAAEKLLRSMLAFDPRERPTARAVLENCRELEHTAPGDSLETWAPTALDRIKTPEDPDGDLGELVGQTLFEEVSTSAQDKKAFMEQLDEATMALSEQEMSSARRQVHEQLEKKPSKTRDRLVLVVLLLAALGTVYVSFFQTADPPVADREAMRERAKAKAELEALLASEANQDLVDAETPDEPGLELDPDEPGLEVAPSEAPAPPKSKAASLPFTDPTPTLEPPVAAEHLEPVSVRISSKPFMIPVLVDGKPVGNTPISNLSLSPGPHVLLFQDGENALRKEIMVTPDGKALWTYLQAEHKVQ